MMGFEGVDMERLNLGLLARQISEFRHKLILEGVPQDEVLQLVLQFSQMALALQVQTPSLRELSLKKEEGEGHKA